MTRTHAADYEDYNDEPQARPERSRPTPRRKPAPRRRPSRTAQALDAFWTHVFGAAIGITAAFAVNFPDKMPWA